MLHWFILGLVLAARASEPEVEAQDSAPTIKVLQLPSPLYDHHDKHDRDYKHENQEQQYHHEMDQYGPGPLVASKFDPHHVNQAHPDVTKQMKIIKETYSPVRSEPAKILDYRYLKTGGRDYVRGPGGQIIILPKHVKSPVHNEHADYDSLLEFLRLKNLAEQEALNKKNKNRNKDEGEFNVGYEAVTGNEYRHHGRHHEHGDYRQEDKRARHYEFHDQHPQKQPERQRNQDYGVRFFEPKLPKDQESYARLLEKPHYH